MKSKQSDKHYLTLFVCLLLCLPTVLLSSCRSSEVTASKTDFHLESKQSIQDLLSEADNKILADSITSYCSVEDFNKYNIKKDAYSRITTSVTILDVEKTIGIPVLRKVGNEYYSVHCIKNNKGDKIYGFILYRESGTAIDGWLTDKIHTEKDFITVATGSNISVVNRIDPYSCFLENINENSATGYHTLADGKEYIVEYERKNAESDYKVVHAHSKKDTTNFSNLLLAADKAIIQ